MNRDFDHSLALKFLRKEFLFVLVFQDRFSLCNPSRPGAHTENKQAALAAAPSSASQELG